MDLGVKQCMNKNRLMELIWEEIVKFYKGKVRLGIFLTRAPGKRPPYQIAFFPLN